MLFFINKFFFAFSQSDKIGNRFRRVTGEKLQAAAQLLVQRFQRAMQPGAARAAHGPVAGIFVIEYVDRQYPTVFGGGVQRRVVVNTEVLAKPGDGQ